MHLLKIILISFVTLVLAGVVALILLITVINPNHFKSTLSSQVEQLTGRSLVIQGNLKWSFFPWLGIELNDATLSNPKGFAGEPFAKLRRVDCYVKLLPLFKKKIQVRQIIIKDANINLIVKANGESNWQDLIKTVPKKQEEVEKTSHQADDFLISIDKLIITNSTVKYSDLQNKQYYLIEHFNLQLNNIKIDQEFPVAVKFFVNNQNLQGQINLNSQVKFNQEKIALKNIKLEGTLQGKQFSSPLNINLMANSDLNIKTEMLTLSGLSVHLANLKAQGELRGEKVLSAARNIEGNITIPQFNLHDFLKQFGQNSTNPTTQVSANTKIKLTNTDFALNNLVVQVGSNKIFGNANWNIPAKKAHLNLKAKEIAVGEIVMQITGKGNIDADLFASGSAPNDLLKTLTGQIHFALHDGALEGIDIKHQFDTAYALIKKQAPPQASGANRTSFGTLIGTVNLVNGVAHNDNLLLQASDMVLTGKGIIDLNTEQINYQLKATLTAHNLDKKVQEIQQYIGGSLPIRITGTFQNYKIYPDMNEIVEQAAKTFMQKQTEKIQEKLGEEVNKNLEKVGSQIFQEKLKNIFH